MDKQADQFLKLVKQGKSYSEIGKIYNCTKTWVYLQLYKFWDKKTIKDALATGQKKRKSKKTYYTIVCKYCGKTKKKPTKGRSYCNRTCYTKALKKLYKEF